MSAIAEARRGEILGRDFLTWLWFRSETGEGRFKLPGGKTVRLWMGDRLVLGADPDKAGAVVSWRGEDGRYREARAALAEGKKIDQARFMLDMDGQEWSFTLDAVHLDLRGLRLPRTEREEGDEAAAIVLERLHLVSQAVNVVRELAEVFVQRRFSPEWESLELPAIRKWVRKASREEAQS